MSNQILDKYLKEKFTKPAAQDFSANTNGLFTNHMQSCLTEC